MTNSSRILLLAAVAALALPSSAVAAYGDDWGDAPPEVIAERTAALDAAEAKWTAAGHRDYSFRIRRYCFCFLGALGPAKIKVTGGRPHGGGKWFKEENTIEELFETIRANLDSDGFEVRYGAKLGVPKAISLDPSLMTADEEVGYEVDRFRLGG
jgi:hypothetical protein